MSITAGTGTAEHMNMAERGKHVLVEWPLGAVCSHPHM